MKEHFLTRPPKDNKVTPAGVQRISLLYPVHLPLSKGVMRWAVAKCPQSRRFLCPTVAMALREGCLNGGTAASAGQQSMANLLVTLELAFFRVTFAFVLGN